METLAVTGHVTRLLQMKMETLANLIRKQLNSSALEDLAIENTPALNQLISTPVAPPTLCVCVWSNDSTKHKKKNCNKRN